jgi:hypothetical protein
MIAMQARTLLLAVPSVAMAVVGLAMFGPGAVQPFEAARIRGGPSVGLRRLSWRIAVLQRYRGVDSTQNAGTIVVRAWHAAASEAVARCRTASDGSCDVTLEFAADVAGPVEAAITAEVSGAVLAAGSVDVNAANWGRAPGHPARLAGQTRGNLAVDVAARRGVFAAPFRDDLVVTVRDGEKPLPDARVALRTEAADLAGAPTTDAESRLTLTTSEDGQVTFGIAPRIHTVDVDIEVTAPGRSASWNGLLPVVPGAIWLDPMSLALGALRVIAPVPLPVAYVTFATPNARLWGGAIPLETHDTRGFTVGHIDWPPGVPRPSSDAPQWITLSSDPLQTGAGTVGWPVVRHAIGDERPFRDQLLLDGMPAAEKRDEDRRHRARALSAVALGAAAVLEGVLLAHGSGGRGVRAWGWTAIAIATVVLAFAAMGVVVMWKTSG